MLSQKRYTIEVSIQGDHIHVPPLELVVVRSAGLLRSCHKLAPWLCKESITLNGELVFGSLKCSQFKKNI